MRIHVQQVLLATLAASILLIGRPVARDAALAQQVSCDAGTPIRTLQQLQNIAKDPTRIYCLVANIDASPTAGWNRGAGFVPIHDFTGILDGQGHSISNLTIHAPVGHDAGLIEKLDNAIVRNLQLVNVTVTGSHDVGGVAGDVAAGEVVNVSVSGMISSSVGSQGGVAGIAGRNLSGIVTAASNTASITTYTATFAGGIVGVNNGGTVSQSNNSGAIQALEGSDVGGVIGDNLGTLTDSYNTGPLASDLSVVGGVVGYNAGHITNTYSTGTISANFIRGGLIGFNQSTQVFSSFWDVTTTPGISGIGETNLIVDGTIAGYSDEGMKDIRNFAPFGWDFSHIWAIQNGVTYPFLVATAPGGLTLRGDYCAAGGTACSNFIAPRMRAGWTFADVEAQLIATSSSAAHIPQHAHLECRSVYSASGVLHQDVGIVDTSALIYSVGGALFTTGSTGILSLTASSTQSAVSGLPSPPSPFSESGRASGLATVDPGGNAGSGRITRGSVQIAINGDIPSYVWKSGSWMYDRTKQGTISCTASTYLNALYDGGESQSTPVADAAVVR